VQAGTVLQTCVMVCVWGASRRGLNVLFVRGREDVRGDDVGREVKSGKARWQAGLALELNGVQTR
jgi:hypothetical protein